MNDIDDSDENIRVLDFIVISRMYYSYTYNIITQVHCCHKSYIIILLLILKTFHAGTISIAHFCIHLSKSERAKEVCKCVGREINNNSVYVLVCEISLITKASSENNCAESDKASNGSSVKRIKRDDFRKKITRRKHKK